MPYRYIVDTSKIVWLSGVESNDFASSLVSVVFNVYLKNELNDDTNVEVLGDNYAEGSFKKLSTTLSDSFSKVLSAHYNSFKGVFKNDKIEVSSRFQAFLLGTFRLSLMRQALWFYALDSMGVEYEDDISNDNINLNNELIDELAESNEEIVELDDETVLYDETDANLIDSESNVDVSFMREDLELSLPEAIDREEDFEEFIFLFLELVDLELDFFNNIVVNMQEFALNSTEAITYFLYSSYSVFGKVPLLPDFHLTVMRTILPYVLRISWLH